MGEITNLVVVAEKLIKEVDSLVAYESLILAVHETVPGFLGETAEDIVVLRVELYFILVQVIKEIISAEDLSNLH